MESFEVDVRRVQVVMEQTLEGDYWYVQGYVRNLFCVNETHPRAHISAKKVKARDISFQMSLPSLIMLKPAV